MTDLIIEQLENADLISGNSVNSEKIHSLSLSEILDIANESVELTTIDKNKNDHTGFSHSASLSLGGSSYPCSSLECRLDKVKHLAQFAALYSDRIYIHNFFADHLKHLDRETPPNEERLRERFATDVAIYGFLRPLITAGYITPVTPPHYCSHCFAEHILGHDDDKNLYRVFDGLADRYTDSITATLDWRPGEYDVHIHGPESLIEHGSVSGQLLNKPPRDKLLTRIPSNQAKGHIDLHKQEISRLGLGRSLAVPVFESVLFEAAIAQILGANFLCERPLYIEILQEISKNPEQNRRNQVVLDHLSCLVPFIANAPPKDLLKLRDEETEAFLVFRQALNSVIQEYLSQHESITKKNAIELYSDVIEPRLATLDKKVKVAKKTLFRDTMSDILSWGGVISFGVFSGILPTELTPILYGLGLKVAADLVSKTAGKVNSKESIETDQMYFLWKVKKKLGT